MWLRNGVKKIKRNHFYQRPILRKISETNQGKTHRITLPFGWVDYLRKNGYLNGDQLEISVLDDTTVIIKPPQRSDISIDS